MGGREDRLLKKNINHGMPKKNVSNNPYCKSKLALDAAKLKKRANADYNGEYKFQEPNMNTGSEMKENTEDNIKEQVTIKRRRKTNRTTERQRLANLELLEIIRKTKESILAIRAKARKADSELLVPRESSNVLPVTVSVIQGKSLMVSQHIVKQTGSVEEEEVGIMPLKSKICF